MSFEIELFWKKIIFYVTFNTPKNVQIKFYVTIT
jgi:hypothetical protein